MKNPAPGCFPAPRLWFTSGSDELAVLLDLERGHDATFDAPEGDAHQRANDPSDDIDAKAKERADGHDHLDARARGHDDAHDHADDGAEDPEDRVLAAFPKATVLRPSILFGKDDNFINMFAGLISTLPVLPVFGPESELQLVYVDDVAEAAVRALEDPGKHGGKIYELGGPETLSMMEINEAIAAAQRRNRTFLPMPDGLSATFAALPGTPMGSDQWKLLKQGNVVSGEYPGFDKLGIEPRPLELFLDRWMVRYRKHGRFHAEAA